MGMYINKGNNDFRDIVAHEYVDKSSLIPLINAMLNSENRYSCVTRCRRFGKSMAAKMLCAYYDRSCDSRELFRGLEAERDGTFGTYLNKYYVISIDMTAFTTKYRGEKNIVKLIQNKIIKEILGVFTQITAQDADDPYNQHRHISHLYGLFPSNQISPYSHNELFAAAKQTLAQRGDEATGWSIGWKICFWARMLDGNHALTILSASFALLRSSGRRRSERSKRFLPEPTLCAC